MTTKKKKHARASTHRGAESENDNEAAVYGIASDELPEQDVLEPEPPCEQCVIAQTAQGDVTALCEVHAQQSLPYESPLRKDPPDGPEQQRQDAWVLY